MSGKKEAEQLPFPLTLFFSQRVLCVPFLTLVLHTYTLLPHFMFIFANKLSRS